MKMAAKSLDLDCETFKEKVFSFILLRSKWIPELKKTFEISNLESVNKIKTIVEECIASGSYFTTWRDTFIKEGYDIEPYDKKKCIYTIKLQNSNFYLALKYRVEDKADFIVGDYAGWS